MGIDALLSSLSTSVLLLNVILYLISFRNSSKTYKVLVFYLITSLIIQCLMEAFAYLGLNNHFLSTYYLIFRFSLLGFFFFYLFKELNLNSLKRSVAIINLLVLSLIIFQYFFYPALYYKFNPIGFLITSLILIGYSIIYLYELLSRKNDYLYLVVGLLIYLISSSIIFISATDIININNDLNYYIWIINASLYLGYQLLISWQWRELYFSKKSLK